MITNAEMYYYESQIYNIVWFVKIVIIRQNSIFENTQ